MDKLVLLGAGASYGSELTGRPVPPLGPDLFDRLASRPGIASRLPKSTQQLFKDFEKGMAEFAVSNNGDIQQFQREMACYLAEFTPSPNSLYCELLKLFDRKETIFASLNYDLLLEEAMEACGYHACYDLKLLYRRIRLIKPHGSSNFWYDLPGHVFRNIKVVNCGTALSAPVRPRNRVESLALCQTDDSFAPAMSLYAKGKEVKTCPDFVIQQQALFEEACLSVKEIYIIGVRVVPEDAHVWGPLMKSSAHLTYFGRGNDESEFMAWVKSVGKENFSFVQGYFGEALDYIKMKL